MSCRGPLRSVVGFFLPPTDLLADPTEIESRWDSGARMLSGAIRAGGEGVYQPKQAWCSKYRGQQGSVAHPAEPHMTSISRWETKTHSPHAHVSTMV